MAVTRGGADPPPEPGPVGAIVLAAGLSTRMGQPKQLLPWQGRPMVRHMVEILIASGVAAERVVVVVGHRREAVQAAVAGLGAGVVFNPLFADGSMLRSLQVGLRALEPSPAGAVLVVLSDQPRLKPAVIGAVVQGWRETGRGVVAPSYGGRRGHPMLFARGAWPRILAHPPAGSPRDVLTTLEGDIHYVVVDDPSVLHDIDTPDDYAEAVARGG